MQVAERLAGGARVLAARGISVVHSLACAVARHWKGAVKAAAWLLPLILALMLAGWAAQPKISIESAGAVDDPLRAKFVVRNGGLLRAKNVRFICGVGREVRCPSTGTVFGPGIGFGGEQALEDLRGGRAHAVECVSRELLPDFGIVRKHDWVDEGGSRRWKHVATVYDLQGDIQILVDFEWIWFGAQARQGFGLDGRPGSPYRWVPTGRVTREPGAILRLRPGPGPD